MSSPENRPIEYPNEWAAEEPLSVEEIDLADPDPFAKWPVYYYRALCRTAIMGGQKRYFLLTFPLEAE